MEKKESDQCGIIDEQALRLMEKEWELFRRVKNRGGPAGCQSDWETFAVMRCSQFMAWPPELRLSYERDLDAATLAGRNLLAEKYAHMMRYTAPLEYEELKGRLPEITAEMEQPIEKIVEIVLRWAVDMKNKYPWLMATSRPIYSAQDWKGTSIETYTRGELATYSVETLRQMLAYYTTMCGEGINLYEVTDSITAQLYGYESLHQANALIGQRLGRTE